MVADSNYYPQHVRHLKGPIINGKFQITGKIPYPIAFRLKDGNRYFSEIIMLAPGINNVKCNKVSTATHVNFGIGTYSLGQCF